MTTPSAAPERSRGGDASESVAVSVIVPVRDDPHGLARCLTALAAQTLAPGSFEVLVVDNGSRDDPSSVVRPFGFARLLREPAGGSYAARNAGAAAARGRVLAFTDADCRPAPDWLEQGAATLRSVAATGLVAGRIAVEPRDGSRPTPVELYELLHAFPQRVYATENGFAATANAFTWRRVFTQTGGFDPALRSAGDQEWGRRVTDAGYQVVYAPHVEVRHPARRTWTDLLAKMERVADGRTVLARRGPPWARGRPRASLQRLVPPVRTWWRAARAPVPSGITQTLGYCLAVTAVRYMWLILPVRRALAGSPAPDSPTIDEEGAVGGALASQRD